LQIERCVCVTAQEEEETHKKQKHTARENEATSRYTLHQIPPHKEGDKIRFPSLFELSQW
jgi:hypothetical protein